MLDAQWEDSERSRRWTGALVEFARGTEGNAATMADWVAKWAPLGDTAIERLLCRVARTTPNAAEEAKGCHPRLPRFARLYGLRRAGAGIAFSEE